MILTSDLVFKNYCVQSISAILFDVGIPNLGWWFLLGWRSGAYHFEVLWLWHWLLASFLGFSCYITAIFPQMCLMLDQSLWGHSSRVCDISCSIPSWHNDGFFFLLTIKNSIFKFKKGSLKFQNTLSCDITWWCHLNITMTSFIFWCVAVQFFSFPGLGENSGNPGLVCKNIILISVAQKWYNFDV